MSARRLKVLLHGRCFDGAASAGLFGRFYRDRVAEGAEVVFAGKAHARGEVFSAAEFDADDHAVVDFRYTTEPRLGWWFDHHASAFPNPGDEAHFAARRARAPERYFFDPHARSCTKFLADSLARVYGWDPAPHAELVRWADIVDGAQFESAAQATQLAEPALELATFIEHNHDPVLETRFIEGLTARSLRELASEPYVVGALAPVRARLARAADVIRARIETAHGVAFFDVGDDDLDGYDRFLPYALAPEAHYVVAVSTGPERTKVSVGSNPWNPARPAAHLARICERYGGGGHAFVGAVTLPADALGEARRIAAEITESLRRGDAPLAGGAG